MRAGDKVEFRSSPRGKWRAVEILGHVDSGPSGWKVLSLHDGKRLYTRVHHESERPHAPCWREHAPSEPAEEVEVVAPSVPLEQSEGRATGGADDDSEE